jgi:hypothetical protein
MKRKPEVKFGVLSKMRQKTSPEPWHHLTPASRVDGGLRAQKRYANSIETCPHP